MTGQELSHYRILGMLGQGGMGVVYRAHDEQLDRDVAFKVLPEASLGDQSARARLVREARSAAALNHPNICTIYEVGEAGSQTYIAMELVEGQPLSARLSGGPLPESQISRLGVQLADALAHAHDRNVIHRDFKSANVVITADGRPKVLDFGLAKRAPGQDMANAATQTVSQTATQPGTLIGTIAYMAPEQLRGQPADARSDIWALGVVLHEMASGSRPFRGTTGFDLSSAILHEAPGPLPETLRPELRSVILRCLEKEPKRRFQHAAELRAALEVVQSGTGGVAAVPRRVSRRWLAAAVAAAAALLAIPIAWKTGWPVRLFSGGGRGRLTSVAVLPLENLSRDAAQAYLVEGIHEALVTELARFGGFQKVIARSSVQRYRRTEKPPREIASELGVDSVLTGSVFRAGERIRVTARLIRGSNEEDVWAGRYERDFGDVMALQNDIVGAITREIQAQLSTAQQQQLAARRPMNAEAHEAYLKGMFYLGKATPEGVEKGMASLRQAVEKDPGHSSPYAGLALGYAIIGHSPAAPPDTMANAKAAAQKALGLNPDEPEALEAMAEAKAYDDRDYDWPGAQKMYERVLQLNPSFAQAHAQYGWYLLLVRRREEALAEMKRSVELDPLNPLFRSWLADHYANAHDLTKAEEHARKSLELDPEYPIGLAELGTVLLGQGKVQEAIGYLEKARKINPMWGWELGNAYTAAGRKEDALKVVASLQQDGRSWNTWGIANLYAAMGDYDRAFEWFEKSFQQRHPYTPWIRVFYLPEPMRKDPRYTDLLRRMNLTI